MIYSAKSSALVDIQQLFYHCRLHNELRSPGPTAATSSSSTEGTIHQHHSTVLTSNSSPTNINTTIKRNPKPKLTTFCSPEAQIMESPLVPKRSPPNIEAVMNSNNESILSSTKS